MILVLILHLIN